ncbi:hypothetical protein D3C78_1336750 [compost metagenome]
MHMVQAATANLLAQGGIDVVVGQSVALGALYFLLAQVDGLARRQISAEHQPGGRTEQWQYRAQLRHHGHGPHGGFDAHHGRAMVAPHRQEAGFVQVVAQFGQGQGGHLQHVHAVERCQAYAQGLAAQAVVVGGGVLLGKPTGDQGLQIPMNLARRHLHVFGQPRQRRGG